MGVGVDVAATMVTGLERRLRSRNPDTRYEVINAGVPGYNTRQQLAYLETEGLKLQPDLVVLGFYVGNDLHDNRHDVPLHVEEGYLRKGEVPQGLLPRSIRSFLEMHSHLYHLVWPVARRLTDPAFDRSRAQVQLAYVRVFAVTEDNESRAIWQATRQRLEEVARLKKAYGFAVLVVIIPDPYQASPSRWKALLAQAGVDEIHYRADAPNNRLTEFCKQLGLPVLDLLPPLARATGPQPVYLGLDGHWTELGNQVAADAVYSYIANKCDQCLSIRPKERLE
jgi:lysophospholipase L1-like esterase